MLNVYSGGSASLAVLDGGGELVGSGGLSVSAMVTGFSYDTISGGSGRADFVGDMGHEFVRSGGIASESVISGSALTTGGFQYVSAGGSAVSTTIEGLGQQAISGGGVALFTTVAPAASSKFRPAASPAAPSCSTAAPR